MSPAAIAAACGFLFSPPPVYDALPLPAGAVAIEVPYADLLHYCGPGRNHFGCTLELDRIAYIPTWATWPGTRACWTENKRHELAHLKGWKHP